MSDNKALVIITTIIFVTTTIFFMAILLPPLFIKTPAQQQISSQNNPTVLPKLAANKKVTKGVLGASILHISRDVQLDGTAWINGDLNLDKDATLHIGDIDVNKLLANAKGESPTIIQKPISQITQEINQTGVLSLQHQTGDLSFSAGNGIAITGLGITNTDLGSSQNIFKTIFVGSIPFPAKNNNDTLSFAAGDGINLTAGNNNTITIANAYGANPSLFINTGAGLSGGGLVSLGGSLSLSNSGVLSITGTTNQITTSGSTGDIILSLPQNIQSSASPMFKELTLSAFTSNGGPLYTNASGVLAQTAAGSTMQVLHSGPNPAFGAVALTTDVSGILPIGNGGTGINTTPTNGQLLIGNGTGYAVANITGTPNQVIVTNGSGTIALSLPQNIDSGASPTFAGLTLSSFNSSSNAVFYATNGSGALAIASTTTSNLCLTSGASVPTWSSCSASSGNLWTSSNGAIYPINATQDLFVGGNASSSAKFALLNMNSGIPTASVSAGISGGVYLTADGTIATTAKQNLNLGSATTGNIVLNGFATGIIHSTSGILSSSAINLAESDVAGILGVGNGGTGSITTPNNGQLLIGNGTGYIVGNISGTTNQVNVTNSIGAITLSLPQNISATSSPIFAGLSLSGNATTSGNLTFQGTSSQVNILNGGTIGFYTSSGGDSGLSVNPSLFIAGNGKVGIGTNNPGTNALQINGGSLYVNGSSNTIIADGIIRSNSLFWMSNGNSGVSSILRLENFNASATGLSLSAKLAGSDGVETEWPYQTITKDTTWTGTASTRNAAVTFNTLFNNTSKEVLRLASTGFVGIGAVSPLATLDIRSQSGTSAIASVSGKTAYAGFVIDNSGNGTLFTASNAGQTKFTIDNLGNTRIVSSLCVKANIGSSCAGSTAGTIYATNQTIQNADYAENYVSSQKLVPGEIIMPASDGNNSAVIKTTKTYQSQTIGVVSTNPGITLNANAQVDSKHPMVYPIALSGRVPVLVSSENGAIHSGDFITTSSLSGVGMKATQEGVVIGKALEEYDGASDKTGTILVYVSAGWANPGVVIAADGSLHIPIAQSSFAAPPISPPPLPIDTALQTQVASLSSQIQRIDDLSKRIAILEKTPVVIASESAAISPSETATISGNFSVTGRTLLSDVGITGKVTAGLLTINGLDLSQGNPTATINTISSPLKLQSLELAGLDILNGKITIDTLGNMHVNAAITAKKYNIDTTDDQTASAGKAIIQKGKTTVDITTTALTPNSLIFATPDTTPVAIAKKQITADTFELTIAQSQNQDLRVDWWIVN